jgi:hypothetical protein
LISSGIVEIVYPQSVISLSGQRSGMTRRIGVVAALLGISFVVVGAVSASNEGGVRILPPEKQKIVDQENLAQQNAPRADKSKLHAPAQSGPLPARISGISDQRSGPFPGPLYAVVNEWNGPVNGEWLTVFAVGPHADRDGGPVTTGGVRIYSEPIQPGINDVLVSVGDRLSKLPGELSIISVSGNVMTLRNVAGTLTTFDLGTKTYR